ncbi:MAG: glutamate--tRNA ligase [Myxococcota bacterium]
MVEKVRVRFAPSPTGSLHLGSARTALFNHLYARGRGGVFILRVEDTDAARSTRASAEGILDGLSWLGLDWDEGPFYQSERMHLYSAAVADLLARGLAYRCVCTAEELKARREEARAAGGPDGYDGRCRDRTDIPEDSAAAVRFKVLKDGETAFDDLVKGPLVKRNAEIDDFVIQRSDGSPIFYLSVTVDDAEMGVTHVIRGDDHVANSFRQVLLLRAMGAPAPRMAHVPLIHGLDKGRLSKRHGATSVQAYRDQGYLPAAMNNYLARLGWSAGDQEIFTRAEMIEKFRLEDVGKSPAIFNPEKLLWLNAHHLRATPAAGLAALARPLLEAAGLWPADPAAERNDAWFERAVEAYRERSRTLVELAESLAPFLAEEVTYEPAAARVLAEDTTGPLAEVADRLSGMTDTRPEAVEPVFREIAEQYGLKLKQVAQPVRVALVGRKASPGIFDVIALMGREKTLARIRRALEYIRAAE